MISRHQSIVGIAFSILALVPGVVAAAEAPPDPRAMIAAADLAGARPQSTRAPRAAPRTAPATQDARAGLQPAVMRTEPRRPGQSLRSWYREQGRLVKTSTGDLYVHAVEYVYANSGHLVQVNEIPYGGGTPTPYWTALAANERGQVTWEQFGNGVETTRQYDTLTGAVTAIASGKGTVWSVQDLTFTWDLAGNLKSRTDALAGHQETFSYDSLYRLTQTAFTPTGGGTATTTYSYGALGQFNVRQDAGTYGYGVTGNPHAVGQVTNRPGGAADTHFCYDGNGNVISQSATTGCGIDTRSFTWGAGNRLKTAQQAANSGSASFQYTPDGARYKQTTTVGTDTTTTVYIGALYERVTTDTGTHHRLYIRAGARVIAEEVVYDTGTMETRYWHRDHLDSVTAITTDTYNGGAWGEVNTVGFYGLYAYAAWGETRNVASGASNPLNAFAEDHYHRGYTGHEMIAAVGVIHMNGRVYLPEIGRFLSPDPFVQFPESTQGYNRYTYVGNNPLSANDPSGHFSFQEFMSVLTSVVGYLSCPATAGAGCAIAAGAGAGTVTGFLATGTFEGALKGAALGGVGGAVFHGIGEKFPGGDFGSVPHLQKIAAHGIAGGLLSAAGGGRFGDGFLGAAAGQLLAPAIDRIGRGADGNISTSAGARITRVMVAAVAGGTASSLAGGKFGTGAITAAFGRMFNDEHELSKREIASRITVRVSVNPETGQHDYLITGEICSVDVTACNVPYSDKVYAHVNGNDVPFSNDDLGSGHKPLMNGYAPIDHFEYPDRRLSINLTVDGHPLHPGNVAHLVHFNNGKLYYSVIGTGTGQNPALNNAIGVAAFLPGVVDVVSRFGK